MYETLNHETSNSFPLIRLLKIKIRTLARTMHHREIEYDFIFKEKGLLLLNFSFPLHPNNSIREEQECS